MLKLMELLQLGKLEKGALTTLSKYKSRNDRWFTAKEKKKTNEVESDDGDDENEHVRFDSVVQLRCKNGASESIEYYRVLSFFAKYYNKWFMATDDQFLWSEDESKVANVRVLTRMMKKQGSSYYEIDLVKGGIWGPQRTGLLHMVSQRHIEVRA